MPTSPLSGQLCLKRNYQNKGLMPGFFSWLETLQKPVDTVTAVDICRRTRIVGVDENLWIIREPLPAIDITVELNDGIAFGKSFTYQELNEGTQQ